MSTISSSLNTLNNSATSNATTGSSASSSAAVSATSNTGNLASTGGQGTLASAGIGSGLNVNQLVGQLMSVAQAPVNLLNTQITGYQNKLSSYSQLSAAAYTFQTALGGLTTKSGFQAITATSSATGVLSATAGATASPGLVSVNVSQLAQAQTLVAAGQASTTTPIGTGAATTISFQFGTISGGTLANGSYSGASFTQDPTKGTGSITINSTNNTLQGIANAINTAGVGVTASIVNDGSGTPWRLSLTSSNAGAGNSMKISVSGDPALQSLLGEDPAGTQSLTQTQVGQSAALTVNGLGVTSNTNTISNAVAGVTLNLTGTGSTTLSLAQDTATITQNVQSFVTAYNTLDSTINQLAAPGGGGGTAGPLAGQVEVEQMQTQLRRALGNSMTDANGNSATLADIGITFQSDGSLSLNSNTLASAMAKNPNEVASLFAQNGSTTDGQVTFLGAATTTQAGNYPIEVSSLATQGTLVGSAPANTTITAGNNDALSVVVDGVSASITIPAGTYTASSLATAVQDAVNGSSALTKAGVSIGVTNNNGVLTFQSASYGSSSFVSLAGSAAPGLAGASPTFTQGTDVVGSIDGMPAKGSGQTLSGLAGSVVDGLSVNVVGGSIGARGSVSLSQGFANTLNDLAGSFNGPNGAITTATTALNTDVTNAQAEITRQNQQLALLQATYTAEFTALDTTISSLNSTQSYLTGQLNSLASTTSYIYSNAR